MWLSLCCLLLSIAFSGLACGYILLVKNFIRLEKEVKRYESEIHGK